MITGPTLEQGLASSRHRPCRVPGGECPPDPRVRIGEFYSYEPVIDNAAAIEPLHNLRIAAKRLRYTLELFRSVLGETVEQNIDRVKSTQEALGNLHDADVRIALIQESLRYWPRNRSPSSGRRCSKLPSAFAAITTAARFGRHQTTLAGDSSRCSASSTRRVGSSSSVSIRFGINSTRKACAMSW